MKTQWVSVIGKQCEYLFPRKDDSPLKQVTFRDHLNKLAYEEKITDREGKLYRFHAHAFRYTVGTSMINNGVPQCHFCSYFALVLSNILHYK